MKTLSQEPEIKNTLDYIQKTNVLVFAIGKASEMTKRRKLPEDKVDEIISKGAVGEAFGHYFNEKGEKIRKHINNIEKYSICFLIICYSKLVFSCFITALFRVRRRASINT